MAYPYPPYGGGYPSQPAYYFIRSRLNGLVFDVEGANRSPGARVTTWNQKPADNDNQLWYDDHQTGTIRSKLNGFTLDLAVGDTLVINPYYPGNPNQQWMRADPFIQNRAMPSRVIDIADNNINAGARLIAFNRHGAANQQFDFQFVGGYAPPPVYPSVPAPVSRRFFIVSEMNGKVLDIEGANRSPGANVIVWPRKYDCQNQLWYLDAQGILRSALNDFALEAHSDGELVRMMPYNGGHSQRWSISGNRIVRDHRNCLDINGANQADGAKIIQWNYKGSVNQHWRIEYV